MFLTLVLCKNKLRFPIRPRIPGHLYRGKTRLVRKVTKEDMNMAKTNLDIEERNMFYLRHPYLTAEEFKEVPQSYFHAREKILKRYRDEQFRRFTKSTNDRTIDSYFRLRIIKSNEWE